MVATTYSFDDLCRELDDGPKTCVFKSLQDSDTKAQEFLSFGSRLHYLAVRVADLLLQLESTEPRRKSQYVVLSVGQWIYSSNKIEFAGTETLEDTLMVIQGKATMSDRQTLDVMQTYNLLADIYPKKQPIETVASLAFDIVALQRWHEKLFLSDLEFNPGKIRSRGVETSFSDFSKHKYPHHSVIRNQLSALCLTVYQLSKLIDSRGDRHRPLADKICDVFCLAAFAQFHFVDIHPFVDGNGRICRLISKRILDAVLPFPPPMFTNRDKYLASLQSARSKDPLDAPEDLARLLLEETIDWYSKLLENQHT
jgi:fido (protein-threonine AMPylation protein)